MKTVYTTKTIKSLTNNNELCKQAFIIYGTSGDDISLIIHKYVLSNDFKLYKNFVLCKKYKNKGLFYLNYSIKLDTLHKVIEWIDELMDI